MALKNAAGGEIFKAALSARVDGEGRRPNQQQQQHQWHADLMNRPAAVGNSLKTAHWTNPYKYIKGSSDVKSSV